MYFSIAMSQFLRPEPWKLLRGTPNNAGPPSVGKAGAKGRRAIEEDVRDGGWRIPSGKTIRPRISGHRRSNLFRGIPTAVVLKLITGGGGKTGVLDVYREAALEGRNATQLPASDQHIQQVMAMQAWRLVGKPGHEASPRVIRGVALVQVRKLRIRINGAGLEAAVFKSRSVINGVTLGEVGQHTQSVAKGLVILSCRAL